MWCRFCACTRGRTVLDLGQQPACDDFPQEADARPDQTYPLRMWWCADCGLAQLADDSPDLREPSGVEPLALIRHAETAVSAITDSGLLPDACGVAEYGSPHGGSWIQPLTRRGLYPVTNGQLAQVVADPFGLMHEPEQDKALRARVERLACGGVLLLQYHSLATILTRGQWTALRHGHYAYYSTPALVRMLRTYGLVALTAWTFDLYGGTVVLAAGRRGEWPCGPSSVTGRLMKHENELGVDDPAVLARLQEHVAESSTALRQWLMESAQRRRATVGYGAASRAVALLNVAHTSADLLPVVADASAAKQGRRMPGSGIPIRSPREVLGGDEQDVLLFLPDLADEVRERYPQVESAGGRWISVDPIPHVLNGFQHASQQPAVRTPALRRHAPPEITVGLPVHNGECFLPSCLASLLNQSTVDFELLVADNCSTDGTEQLCRDAAERDERVRYVRRRLNIGPIPNHNRLVYEARAPYFTWAAADDEYPAGRLEGLLGALRAKPEAVLAFSSVYEIDVSSTVIGQWCDVRRMDSPDPVLRMRELLARSHPALHLYGLMRREVLLRTGLMPPIGTGDKVLLAELALHGSFTALHDNLLLRRRHPGQLSERTTAREYARLQRDRRIILPNLEEGYWYLRAVRRAPLSPRDRARALWTLRLWLRDNAVPAGRNLARAAVDAGRVARQSTMDRV